MAFSYTYTTLLADLASFTEDQGTEFAAILPTLIGLGETRLMRDLELETFDAVATSTLTPSSAFVTKPTDLVATQSFHIVNGSGAYVPLEEKSYDYIREFWSNPSTTAATPRYFCEYSTTQWLLAGTPASGLTYYVRYIKRPDGLSVGNPTTWLSTHVPDALLYACLISAEEFLKADNRIPVWGTEYARVLTAAKAEVRKVKRDDYMPMTGTPVKERE